MHATLMPAGAAAMLQIIGVAGVAAAGFIAWLWRAHRRLQRDDSRER